jgi:hypothetical protein
MRIFQRLLPFLVLVLLVGVVWARPVVPVNSGHELASGLYHPPTPPRLDFGTVVRDTADEQCVEPDRGASRYILQAQVGQGLPAWVLFFVRSWVPLALGSR